jgi:hypothetical protein
LSSRGIGEFDQEQKDQWFEIKVEESEEIGGLSDLADISDI